MLTVTNFFFRTENQYTEVIINEIKAVETLTGMSLEMPDVGWQGKNQQVQLNQVGITGLGFFVAAILFLTVGFSVPYWATIGLTRIGLWEACYQSHCMSTSSSVQNF